jgi:hypothetical protein
LAPTDNELLQTPHSPTISSYLWDSVMFELDDDVVAVIAAVC